MSYVGFGAKFGLNFIAIIPKIDNILHDFNKLSLGPL